MARRPVVIAHIGGGHGSLRHRPENPTFRRSRPGRNETCRVDDDDSGMAEWVGRRSFDDVLAAARNGDDLSFGEIWRWLHPPLVRWLRVVVSGEVDDIESEVWLSIARNLASFSGDERDFRGWVFTIARRRAIDWRRHRQRQPRVTDLDGVDVADHAAASSPQTDTAAALAMLGTLTPEQREALALRIIVGMSVRETAAVVHRSEGAVRIICHRGLRTLARQLAADRDAERDRAMSDPREEPFVTSDVQADELEAGWFERLLDGLDADGVPGIYEPLAGVLLALRTPENEDLGGEAAAIAMFRSCQAGATSPPAGIDRAPTAKALAAAVAVVLATVTGARCGRRRLPADIQDMTSELLDNVGIHIPSADRTSDTETPPRAGRPAASLGPVTATPGSSEARRGLPTRNGTATTEPVRTSAIHPPAGTPPAAAAPSATANTVAAVPAGAADPTAADAAAATAAAEPPAREAGTDATRPRPTGRPTDHATRQRPRLPTRRPTDHATRQRPRLPTRRPTDHATRQRPRLPTRRPTDHPPPRQRPRLPTRRPTDHPTRQRPGLPACRRAGSSKQPHGVQPRTRALGAADQPPADVPHP